MKKILIIVMSFAMMLAFCACGSEEPEEPTAYSPTDIQAEEIEDGTMVYSVIYEMETEDSDAWKEQWSGYDTNENEVQTAIDGVKECMQRDDWTDGSVVYGYANEALLKNMLYSYGQDYVYDEIALYQLGIYNDSYVLQGELD